MIANRVEREEEGQILFKKLYSVVQRFLKLPMSYLGSIPYDAQLSRAVMQQVPVSLANPNAKSALAYERIAARLLDKEEASRTVNRGMAAFFAHIIGKK